MNGVINFDKPAGISSARAVGRVKRLLPRGTKIGHAGTLDPFATGVLLLLVGKATKLCEQLMDAPKQYECTLKLGFNTETDDPESSEVRHPGSAQPPESEAVEAALRPFIGEILQRPPAFSALKIGGQRAYKAARQGKPVALEPRKVKVYSIELLDYNWPLAHLRIDCGRGTYIRAIARDLGDALGVGAYLTQLRRTRIGSFGVADALALDVLERDGVVGHLRPQ